MNIPDDIPLLPDTKNLVVLEEVIKNADSRLIKIDFMNKPLSKNTATRVEKLEDVGRVLGAVAGSCASFHRPDNPNSNSARVEFMLGDKWIRGWLGRFFFNNGDFVKVVAAKRDDHYECFAVLRPTDKIITTYPWSTRGFASLDKERRIVLKWAGSIFLILTMVTFFKILSEGITVVPMIVSFLLCLAYGIRPERRYCAVAEDIFKVLGWNNPSDINLEKKPAGVKVPERPGSKLLTLNYFYKDEWCLVQSPDTGPSNEAKVT